MTTNEIIDEIESAIEREKTTRGGVIIDTTTARAVLDAIGGVRGKEAKWIISETTESLCSHCGFYGKVGMKYCGYCGAKMTDFVIK